jgi:hypothetical protein
MDNWFFPRVTDYWDSRTDALETLPLRIAEETAEAQGQIFAAIREAIVRHVERFPDEMLLKLLCVVADDIYKVVNRASQTGTAYFQYLGASAGTLFSVAGQRGCVLHYLVDNLFEATEQGLARPLRYFPNWFQAAGLVYICPQELGVTLMQADKVDPAQHVQAIPRYIQEATHVAWRLAARCHEEGRHYVFLNASDSPEPFSFELAMQVAGGARIMTALRTEAPTPGSNIMLYPPKAS